MIDVQESGATPPDVAKAMDPEKAPPDSPNSPERSVQPEKDQSFWIDFKHALAERFQELVNEPELQQAAAQFAASLRSQTRSAAKLDLNAEPLLGKFQYPYRKTPSILQRFLDASHDRTGMEDFPHPEYVLRRGTENVSESAIIAYLIFKELNRDVTPQPVRSFKEKGIGVYHSMIAYVAKDIVSLETILSARSPIALSGYTGTSNPNGKNDAYGELYIEPTDDAEVTYIGRGDVYSYYYPNGERAPSRGNLTSRTLEDVKLGEATELFLRLRSNQVKAVHLIGGHQAVALDKLIAICKKHEIPLIKHTQPRPNRYWEICDAVSDIEYIDIYAEDPYGDPVYPVADRGHAKLKELGMDYQTAKQFLRERVEEFNEDYYEENIQIVP